MGRKNDNSTRGRGSEYELNLLCPGDFRRLRFARILKYGSFAPEDSPVQSVIIWFHRSLYYAACIGSMMMPTMMLNCRRSDVHVSGDGSTCVPRAPTRLPFSITDAHDHRIHRTSRRRLRWKYPVSGFVAVGCSDILAAGFTDAQIQTIVGIRAAWTHTRIHPR